MDNKTEIQKYIDKNYVNKKKILDKINELDLKRKQYFIYKTQGVETDTEYYNFIADDYSRKILEELLK